MHHGSVGLQEVSRRYSYQVVLHHPTCVGIRTLPRYPSTYTISSLHVLEPVTLTCTCISSTHPQYLTPQVVLGYRYCRPRREVTSSPLQMSYLTCSPDIPHGESTCSRLLYYCRDSVYRTSTSTYHQSTCACSMTPLVHILNGILHYPISLVHTTSTPVHRIHTLVHITNGYMHYITRHGW